MIKLFKIASIIFISISWINTLAQNNLYKGFIVRNDSKKIPFNFEFKDSLNKKIITIINGDERFPIHDINVSKDSIKIVLPLFDTEIKAKYNQNYWEGDWIRTDGKSISKMKFMATADSVERFIVSSAPNFNISGKWETYFGPEKKYAIGEFMQINNKLYGTFLTKSGDYRFLEGIVNGNSFSLSTFDGSHAFLFEGDIKSNQVFEGKFYSANNKAVEFTATKNDNARLPDSYSLTQLKDSTLSIDFSFPDLENKIVSLKDNRFKNKIVLVQILGSWCPNCMDEIAYLSNLYNNQNNNNIEVVGLAYERTTDFEKSKISLQKVKDRFNVNYPILITGYTNDKSEVLKSLVNLKNFSAFPTLIIIGKNGKVDKIHTGFNGPGTGAHYEEFKQEFENYLSNLLKQ